MLSEDVVEVPESDDDIVLILVVVEYALWVFDELRNRDYIDGLNPCCNGTCSLS